MITRKLRTAVFASRESLSRRSNRVSQLRAHFHSAGTAALLSVWRIQPGLHPQESYGIFVQYSEGIPREISKSPQSEEFCGASQYDFTPLSDFQLFEITDDRQDQVEEAFSYRVLQKRTDEM